MYLAADVQAGKTGRCMQAIPHPRSPILICLPTLTKHFYNIPVMVLAARRERDKSYTETVQPSGKKLGP